MPHSARDRSSDLPVAWFSQVFAVLLLIWIALNGLGGLVIGILAALAGASLGAWLAPEAPYPWRPWRWLVFAFFFLWESFKGGADVALRAIHPDLPLSPGFNNHPIRLPAGKPTTLLVSFISLLPGTLSVSLDEQRQQLVVHALANSGMSSVRRLEDMLSWVFDAGEQRP
ncbi:MAG: Na+/H+ antiporter subunit E [Wenzhouxiangella sp.]|nr:Na+/H+ antiporter subunit E [Wenzhouxiangella sp.]